MSPVPEERAGETAAEEEDEAVVGTEAAGAGPGAGPGAGAGAGSVLGVARLSPSWDDGLIARRASVPADDGSGDGGSAGSVRAVPVVPLRRGGNGRFGEASLRPLRDGAYEEGGYEEEAESPLPVPSPSVTGTPLTRDGASLLTPPAANGRTKEDANGGEADAADDVLRQRLGALRELVGLSRTRLDAQVLAEAGKVLDEAAARRGLPRAYTTVALAGATGSGKSSLFNSLTGDRLSETGMCRPTTAAPVACTWQAEGADGADGLLDRLGIAPQARHRKDGAALGGLVLLDLPDHDSVAQGHREQVDRMLELVDAVVWVVDPEKYADAVLHERYLRRLSGHAEVTFVVLNQKDRLTGDAVDAVLDDLRRLLDDDGMALGEHGEPGACVLAASALTGEGVGDLREELGGFAASRRAATLRLTADLDGAMDRLRPVYAGPGPGAVCGTYGELPAQGLTDEVREDFEDRLALAVGAAAVGQAAERAWLRESEEASATPWTRLRRRQLERTRAAVAGSPTEPGEGEGDGHCAGETCAVGGDGGFDADGSGDGDGDGAGGDAADVRVPYPGTRATRPVLARAVRELADQAARGLPEAWARNVRDTTRRGSDGLPEALDEVMREGTGRTGRAGGGPDSGGGADGVSGANGAGAVDGAASGGPEVPRLPWRGAVVTGQWLLLGLQALGALWLMAAVLGVAGGASAWPLAAALLVFGAAGGPLLAWLCAVASRGPARAYGQEQERRLRRLASACGRARVLEPVAAELVRYREVREQYAIAAGAVASQSGVSRVGEGVVHS